MQHQTIQYVDGEDVLLGQLFYENAAVDPRPAIILFPAFEGLSEFALDYAKKLAREGYTVFAADMYGNATTADTIDSCMHLITPFLQDRSIVRRRAQLAYQTLQQQSQVAQHKIGAIGFCFGGMCVLELARSGEPLQAGVLAHGILAKSDLPTRPISTKILALQGYQDPQVPATELQAFAQEMDEAGVTDWTYTFFGQAKHSFTDRKTGTFDPNKEKAMGREYHEIAATRSYRYALDFFQEVLG